MKAHTFQPFQRNSGRKEVKPIHELPVTKNILELVLNYAQEAEAERVTRITLRVGELTDFIPEILQRYFDYISKGTIAAGAAIVMIPIPLLLKCENCAEIVRLSPRRLSEYACPACGSHKGALESGLELLVEEIEVV
jgi:hydrogenase nickel incorporation protein HypA/HybF